MIRKIITIDEEKCDGCGLCVPSCTEGAIKIVNGKAVLAADNLCDGLGDCLSECPKDAIKIIEREAEAFDEAKVKQHLSANASEKPHHGCPGMQTRTLSTAKKPTSSSASAEKQQSMLGQWPIQLSLVSVSAPYFQNADLLVAADCVPFAYADFHREVLAGKALVIGCPKLDDNQFYIEKLTELFKVSTIKSVTIIRMEVPCCNGLTMAVKRALAASGKEIPCKEMVISINGELL
ncbi:MAG: 4Fe-4S binding protein [Desulfuromonadales bacterium]|nr:4Fe-4S binding protein [Desulfuromonadales bacterium]